MSFLSTSQCRTYGTTGVVSDHMDAMSTKIEKSLSKSWNGCWTLRCRAPMLGVASGHMDAAHLFLSFIPSDI